MNRPHDPLIARIKQGDKHAFDQVFISHFKRLKAYAHTWIKEADDAEEIVQNVFVRIWTRREQLQTNGALNAFLYRSVYNECLNHLKHQKIRANFSLHVSQTLEKQTGNLTHEIMAAELKKNIYLAINDLPDKCRQIFELSRFNHLKYHEIAETLNLSVKTVENQMGKALRVLRLKMADFLILLLLLIK